MEFMRLVDMVKKCIFLCLGLFLFLLFFHKGIETEDVWIHLSIGQWIVHHLQVPHQDVFPFASEKIPYLCHEWLASSSLYLAFKAGGFAGLKLFRSLFFMLSIGIFFVFSYRRIPFSFLIFLTLLMSYALFQRCLLRPDTFNLLFIQLFLISLFSYERNGGRWKLFILPFIAIFWLNLHMMGAFIYGGSIVFIFLLSSWINYLIQKNAGYPSDIVSNLKKQVQEFDLTFLVFLAIFLINPYGVEGLLFPYKVIFFPKYYGFYKMISMTGELQDSAYIFFSLNYIYYILLIVFSILFLFLNKRIHLTLNLLFTLALIAFLYMSRNSSFFTLVAVYVIAQSAQNIEFIKKWASWRWSVLVDIIIITGVTLFVMLQAFNMFNEKVYFKGEEHRALFLETNPYLTSTISLLKDNNIHGPVFNCTLLGGAIMWFDYPELRPFDDGRHLDYQRYSDMISVLLNPKENWRKVSNAYDLKIVVLTEGYQLEKDFIKYLSSQQDWQLIAINGPFVVYVKRGEFHLSDELNSLEQRLKADILTVNDIKQLKISLRGHRTSLEKFFNPAPLLVDLFSNGVTLTNLGYKGSAAKDFIDALRISDQSYMQVIVRAFLGTINKT